MKRSPTWLQGFDGVARDDVALAPFSHIRIGGPAEHFVEPVTDADVALLVRVAREDALPLRVLGGGNNLLIPDRGVRGMVMGTQRLAGIHAQGPRLVARGGTSLSALIRRAEELGLAGLETLAGIPAFVGGAVAMNAGTRAGETFDRLASVIVVDPDGEIRELLRAQLQPRYRDAGLDGHVVLAAAFDLVPDDPAQIRRRFNELMRRRNETQPTSAQSLGCIFRNPPGDAAGRLIDSVGLKGMRVGPVVVSHKHANYFVNEGGGAAADVLALIELVQSRVLAETGIALEPEIRIWADG